MRVLALWGKPAAGGIAPALGAAASVGRSPVMDHRPGCGASDAMAGLSLGVGQRSVAEGLAGKTVASMRSIRWRRLQRLDRPPDPLPEVPSLVVVAIVHQVLDANADRDA